jgi:hypothetical protein
MCKRKIITTSLLLHLFVICFSQNTGIGVANPQRAKLEVWGANGTGTTVALIGDARAISLHRSYAGIGLNMYTDQNNTRRYLYSGYAGLWQSIHDDATLAQGLNFTIYPSGGDDAILPSANRVWNFTSNNRFQIQSTGAGGSAHLDVGRGTGSEGTAMLQGTNYNSNFNYSTAENTYIRGGKASSNVILNDIPGGKVVLGGGAATIGVNTNYYVPPTTLEVRQYSGGMELSTSNYPNLAWEWRVANGSPANYYAYYGGAVRTYFSYTDGALHPVSDARIKSNVVALPTVMDKLIRLRPVSYKMKEAANGQQRSIGFIAQEVQELFPILVSQDMPGVSGRLGLNYAGFNMIAIKGIQEEQAKIENLDRELSGIDKRLKLLEQKLASQSH